MSNYAAVIVTYYPDATDIENFERISEKCDQVFVIDNTPEGTAIDFPVKKNIVIHKCRKNVGLASALNMGIELALKESIENIFLFDQDSRPSNDFFDHMLAFKTAVKEVEDKWAFYVPDFYDRNSKTFANFPLLTRFTFKHATCKDVLIFKGSYSLIAITSGTLITAGSYSKIGPMREDFFIDFVDNEYCLRAARLGLMVAVNCETVLNHSIGNRSTKRLLGLTIKPNHHPPVRRYYIARNGIRTAVEYFSTFPSYALLFAARITYEIISIILYEKNKNDKIKAVIYGMYHGLVGKMGKCTIPSI